MTVCGGLDYSTAYGTLVIDDVTMHCPAWDCVNVFDLWLPADVRGSDRLLPGVPGVTPYRRRRTVTERSLELVISSRVLGPDGTDPAPTDPEGLEANISYLRENLVDPTNTGDGTRTAVLTMPSGEERTGPVHVLRLVPGVRVQAGMLAVIDISIPNGVLEAAAP